MKKVSLIHCNTMLIPSASQHDEEYICEDINDFIKCEQHCSRVVQDFVLRDLKIEAKVYGKVVLVNAIRAG